MKKIVAIIAVIIAVLLFAQFYRLIAIGEIGFEALTFEDEDWISNLKSENPREKDEVLVPLHFNAVDMLYERAGKLYAGEKKYRIDADIPMYVNGATALMNISDSAKLINDEFQRLDSYYGLLVSAGHSFNYDNMTQADPDDFILVRMKANIFSNVKDMVVRGGDTGTIEIPLNSMLYHTPESLSYYAYEVETGRTGGVFVFHRITGLDEESTVSFEGKSYNYYDYLRRLGLLGNPPVELPYVDEDDKIDDDLKGDYDNLDGNSVVPIIPTPVPPSKTPSTVDGGGVAPIEDEPGSSSGTKIPGAAGNNDPKPGAPALPASDEEPELGYREPTLRLSKMRVNYNEPEGGLYKASARLSVIDKKLLLTGDIKIYLLNSSGSLLQTITVSLPAGRDLAYVYETITVNGLYVGGTYKVYGEYKFTDDKGVVQTRQFSEQEFTVTLPILPEPATPPPSPPSDPVDPNYVKPTVTATALTAKTYSLHGNITINDPAGRITKGITYVIWDHDPGEYVSGTDGQYANDSNWHDSTDPDIHPTPTTDPIARVVRRVYIYGSGEVRLDPLVPDTTYWVTSHFIYMNEPTTQYPDGRKAIEHSYFATQKITTEKREVLAPVVVSLANGQLYPDKVRFENFVADLTPTNGFTKADVDYTVLYTRRIQIDFEKASDPTWKRSVTLNDADRTAVLNGDATHPLSFLSAAIFDASTTYKYTLRFFDVHGTEIIGEDSSNHKYTNPGGSFPIAGTIATCKSPPKADMNMAVNKVAEFTLNVNITNPNAAKSWVYRIEIVDMSTAGNPVIFTTMRRGSVGLGTNANQFPLVMPSPGGTDSGNPVTAITGVFSDSLTYLDLPIGKALKAVVYADYDIADTLDNSPFVHVNQVIGEFPFITAPLSSLGDVVFDDANFRLTQDGYGAIMDFKINDGRTDDLLQNLLSQVKITFTPRDPRAPREGESPAATYTYIFSRDNDDGVGGTLTPGEFVIIDEAYFDAWKWNKLGTMTGTGYPIINPNFNTVAVASALPEWPTTITNTYGEFTTRSGKIYVLTGTANSSSPDIGGSGWTLIPEWVSGQAYPTGTRVNYAGSVYESHEAVDANEQKTFDHTLFHVDLSEKLLSMTDYDITYTAMVKINATPTPYRYTPTTQASRYNFKTLRRLPEVRRSGEFVASDSIDVYDLYVYDPDEVCTDKVQLTVTNRSSNKVVYGETLYPQRQDNGYTVVKRDIALANLEESTDLAPQYYDFSFTASSYNQGYDTLTYFSNYGLINYTYNTATEELVQIPDDTTNHLKAAPFAIATRAGLSGRIYLGGITVTSATQSTAKFYVDLEDVRNEIDTEGGGVFYVKVWRYENTADGQTNMVLVNSPGSNNWLNALNSYNPSRETVDHKNQYIDAFAVFVPALASKFQYRVDLSVVIDGHEKILSSREFDTDTAVLEIRDIEDFALITQPSYVGLTITNGVKTEIPYQGLDARFVITRDLVLDPLNYNLADAALTETYRELGFITNSQSVNLHGKYITGGIGAFLSTNDRNQFISGFSDANRFQGLLDFQGFSFTNNTERGYLIYVIGQYGEIRNMVMNTSMFAYPGVATEQSRLAWSNLGWIHDIQLNVGQEDSTDPDVMAERAYVSATNALAIPTNADSVRYSAAKTYNAGDKVYYEGRLYKLKDGFTLPPAKDLGSVSNLVNFHPPLDSVYWEDLGMVMHLPPETQEWNNYGGMVRANSGVIERFVVRVNQPVYARDRFGFIASTSSGTIRDGYVYAAPTMIPKEDGRRYAIQMVTKYQVGGAAAGGAAVGGITGTNDTNGVLERVYSSINILGLYDNTLHPDFTQFGTLVGRNNGIARDSYTTGQVAYRQSKSQWIFTDANARQQYTTDGTTAGPLRSEWITSEADAGYNKAWYYPGVWYANPVVRFSGDDVEPTYLQTAYAGSAVYPSLPNTVFPVNAADLTNLNKQNNVAYGPGVGSQAGKMSTQVSYYSPDEARTYNAAYNTKVGVESLRTENWQKNLLGGGFNTANTVILGYYPQVIMDTSMPPQEFIQLPMNSTPGADIKVTSSIVEQQTEDYAVVALTLKNPSTRLITQINFEYAKTTAGGPTQLRTLNSAVLGINGDPAQQAAMYTAIGKTSADFGTNRRQINSSDGTTRIWIVVFKPLEPQPIPTNANRRLADNDLDRGAFLSRYYIDDIGWKASSLGSVEIPVGNQHFPVDAEFYQPISTLKDWVRYVATDYGTTARTSRNYRIKADIDFSLDSFRTLLLNSTDYEDLINEQIYKFSTTGSAGNNTTGSTGTVLNATAPTAPEDITWDNYGVSNNNNMYIPEYRVGHYAGASYHVFTGHVDGSIFNSNMELIGMHSLDNINIRNKVAQTHGGGLFAYVTGKITNLMTKDMHIDARGSVYTGFVQILYGGKLDNVHLRGDTAYTFTNSAYTSDTRMGGLASYATYGEIWNSSIVGLNINSQSAFTFIGGLVGDIRTGILRNSYITGLDITAQSAKQGNGIGGIIGYADTGSSLNMYAEGRIDTSDQLVGGIAGRLAVNQTMQNTWNLVHITSMADSVGGIVGGYTSTGAMPTTNSLAWGNVTSAWVEYSPDPLDPDAKLHRGAGDGLYRTQGTARSNAYAWVGQKINGKEHTLLDDTIMLRIGTGADPLDLTDLRNFNTYDRAIKMGSEFDYTKISESKMPLLKNSNGVWWPVQAEIPYPGTTDGISAKIIATEGVPMRPDNVTEYRGAVIWVQHPTGTTLNNVTISGLTTALMPTNAVVPNERPGQAEAGMTISSIKVYVTAYERYFDQYEITSVNLTVATNVVQDVDVEGQLILDIPAYLDIPNAYVWQQKLSTVAEGGHGDDFENIRITGTIDFSELYGSAYDSRYGAEPGGSYKLTDGALPRRDLKLNRLEGLESTPGVRQTIRNFISFQNVAQQSFASVEDLNDFFTENPDQLTTATIVSLEGDLYKCGNITATTADFLGSGITVIGTWTKLTTAGNKDGSGNIGGSLVSVITAEISKLHFEQMAFATSGRSVGVVGKLMGSAKELQFDKISIKKTALTATNVQQSGIFGAVNGSMNKIWLNDIYVEGYAYTGGLAGYSRNSNFTNIEANNVTVISNYVMAGGMLGYANNTLLLNSHGHQILVQGSEDIGGLAGYLHTGLPWATEVQYGNDIQDAIVVGTSDTMARTGGMFGRGNITEKPRASNEAVAPIAAGNTGIPAYGVGAGQQAASITVRPVYPYAQFTMTNPANLTVIDHVFVRGGQAVGGMTGQPSNSHHTRSISVSNSFILGGAYIGGITGLSEAVYDANVRDSVISTIYCEQRDGLDSTADYGIAGYVKWRAEYLLYWTTKAGPAGTGYGTKIKYYNGDPGGAMADGKLYSDYIKATVTATKTDSEWNTRIGGIVARYHTTNSGIVNSFVGSTSADRVGGIIGHAYTYATTSHSVLNTVVRGRDYVGGYVGYMENAGTNINAINADVIGRNFVGGVAGYFDQNQTYYGTRTSYIKGTYFVGTVEAKGFIMNKAASVETGQFYAGGIAGSQGSYKLSSTATYRSNSNVVAATVTVPNSGGHAAFLYQRANGDSSDTAAIPGKDQYVYVGSRLIYSGGGATQTVAGPSADGYTIPKTVSTDNLKDPKWWNGSATWTTADSTAFYNYYNRSNDAATGTQAYQYFRYTVPSAGALPINNGYMPYLTKYGTSGHSTGAFVMQHVEGRPQSGSVETYATAGVLTYHSVSDSTYSGGIPIPTGTVGAPTIQIRMMSLMPTELPLPVPTFYAAGGASGLNIDFDYVNPDTGFSVKYDGEAPFAEWNVDQRTFTLDYKFNKALVITVTDGKKEQKYRVDPEDVQHTIMVWGDNYYYGNEFGVHEKDGRLLSGAFANLRDGQGITKEGSLYDIVTGKLLEERVISGLRQEVSPRYSFEYAGYKLDVFGTYTLSTPLNGGEPSEIEGMLMLVKNGYLKPLDASLPVNYDELVYDIVGGEEYLTFLEESGRVSDAVGNPIALPKDFRNYDIVEMTNTLNTDLPYVMVRYDTGVVVCFNYLTGERVNLNVIDGDMSLLKYAKGFFGSPSSVMNSLADGYLEMKPMREVLMVYPLEEEMLEAAKSEAGTAEIKGTNEDGLPDGGAEVDKDAAGANDGTGGNDGAGGNIKGSSNLPGGTNINTDDATGSGKDDKNGTAPEKGQLSDSGAGGSTAEKPSGADGTGTDSEGKGAGNGTANPDGTNANAEKPDTDTDKGVKPDDADKDDKKPESGAEGENGAGEGGGDADLANPNGEKPEPGESVAVDTDKSGPEDGAESGEEGGPKGAGLDKPETKASPTYTMAYNNETGKYEFYDVARLLAGDTLPAIEATEENTALAAQLLDNYIRAEAGTNRVLPKSGIYAIGAVSLTIVVLLVVIFDKRRKTW
ncbi:MAG: hypothetical protein LBN00_12420 [Oscillospiraceae bacterium]|jgi:hypothetical protein|nr:hypothetical protein [Oscillospiraceae bacterium]